MPKLLSTACTALLLLLYLRATCAAPDGGLHVPRATCRTQAVAAGDTCTTLAQKCGISPADFTTYNSNPNPCGSLREGQLVCCSVGTKPDRRPKQNADGSCATYITQPNEYCDEVAASHDLATADLSSYNDKTTWGWTGCHPMARNISICLSTGTPPMPAPLSNAVCGPIKPGTAKPAAGTDLTTLNPCPLNACCDHWGQCGITPEFCTPRTGPTGNPGTAPVNQTACISNCGTYIANAGAAPSTRMSIAYFETWNWDRPCLNQRVQDIDKSKYTHIHWAFVDIDANNHSLIVNNTYGEWETFKELKGVKRVISLGGWGFSTGWSTYNIFRTAVTGSDNNLKFANNIINFLKQHNLDGVDLDWEYPGSPDNQGEPWLPPTGAATDALAYWSLMRNLKNNMPAGMTVSAAVPASFWYLKAYPLKEMANYLDYIVAMTYDLHGQWDFGNKWTQEGCGNGDCLRSHVNGTETGYALSMITKAGVPTNKIVVGVTSYGRSFAMADKNCLGPTCKYKGPASSATKGRCTGVAGYIANAEINEIISQGGSSVKNYYDAASMSNILVYGDGQYVAYMNDTTKSQRMANYKAYNFLGTADWAVDLQSYYSSQPGQFSPSNSAQWDLSFDQIISRYGTGGWDINTIKTNVCVFYHGTFREQAEAYVCTMRGSFPRVMMSDMFLPEAFYRNNGPRAAARAAGQEQEWFRRLSEIFASICDGDIRVVWDGQAAMNIGSTTSPSWHSMWDWYEWPILNQRVQGGTARILRVDPSTFVLSPYEMPTDHSTPPPGFAPPMTRKPPKRSLGRRDMIIDSSAGSPSVLPDLDHGLSKRTTVECERDTDCLQCVEDRMAGSPNTEVAFANFNDDMPWVPGKCEIDVKQYQFSTLEQGHTYITLNVSVSDNERLWIGGDSDRKFDAGYYSAVHSNLPSPVWVGPYGQQESYLVMFRYKNLQWYSDGDGCIASDWQISGPRPALVSLRDISCNFNC